MWRWSSQVPGILFLVLGAYADEEATTAVYGVDVSWPMQHTAQEILETGGLPPPTYTTYMEGCYSQFGKGICDMNEADRISWNRFQPSEQKNFTSTGFVKTIAPEKSFHILRDFMLNNGERKRLEHWETGNIHINHWEVETYSLLMDDPDESTAMSLLDRRQLLSEVQATLEDWIGVPLTPTFMYGIRIYQPGSILAPHVDRLPLVVSCVMNVGQKVEEDWVLELIGHDGRAVNLTMTQGDMVLYESHSVIHGRPFPLKGDFYANAFFHFEPVGYTAELEMKLKSEAKHKTAKEKFEEALEKQDIQSEDAAGKRPDLPWYIDASSEEAARWRQEYIFNKDKKKRAKGNKSSKTEGVTRAHKLAADGYLEELKQIASKNPAVLHEPDGNGWQPIHEAARSGQTEVIEYLIQAGAKLNVRTNNGNGATPLWWAQHMLPHSHPAVKLLQRNGAIAIAPGD